jgi:hypothetical protein
VVKVKQFLICALVVVVVVVLGFCAETVADKVVGHFYHPGGGALTYRYEVGANHAPVSVHTLTAKEKVSCLRQAAITRHLRWEVICVPKTSYQDKHYMASAFQPGDNSENSRDVEDGAKDWWAEDAATPEDAAYALYLSIQKGAPNESADHKEAWPAGDCSYNTVMDSKHADAIPCKSRRTN